MPGMTFKSLFEGKYSTMEDKITVDHQLLSRLVDDKIITDLQRRKIEVNCVTVCKFS